MKIPSLVLTLAGSLLIAGCQASRPPLETVEHVDLERFMGDWYVIASIPTIIEKGAHNAVESYRLDEDGTVATTFTFRKDAFDGEEKVYTPRGFIVDTESNALWGMQFVWPIKGDYRIIYLTEDYSETIIGRNKRDYVWYMARTPQVSDEHYARAVKLITEVGYDIDELKRVPQEW
jgi:apolipoprotein D and lipocalin family protein